MSNQFNKIPPTVFHGTTYNHLSSLKTGVDVNTPSANKKPDFGVGFYTTTNWEQAAIQARRKASALNKVPDKRLIAPIVITYNLDTDALQNLPPLKGNKTSSILFETPNEQWGQFVLNNRLRLHSAEELHNIDQRYHYVFGPLADGSIMGLLNDFQTGKISSDEFFNAIKPKKNSNGLFQDQLSFHTDLASKLLNIKGVTSANE